jgi:DNA-binding transcriptional regulator WhiA
MLAGGLDESRNRLHGLLELADEAVMLAVTPGLAEIQQLRVEHGHLGLEVLGEILEARGKASQFARINVRL